MPLQQVISGGQTGVDQMGLFVAKELCYDTGGVAPKGYRTDAGVNLLLRDLYGLTESWTSQYAPRTLVNVRTAHATVWFGNLTSPGYRCTMQAIEIVGRPVIVNPTGEQLCNWLDKWWKFEILNVAGNRLRTNPEATEAAKVALTYAFNELIPF